ncbi:MAG: hypothetical protein KJP14_03270 [Eudoraea sp.]|nr:hypothetical protein [Eudoraea sp.]
MGPSKTRLYTNISLVFLLSGVAMLGFWSFLFDPTAIFKENLTAFHGYIPGVLENLTLGTVVSMFLYGGAILFAILGDTTSDRKRYGVHYWVILVAAALLILNAYSLIRY